MILNTPIIYKKWTGFTNANKFIYKDIKMVIYVIFGAVAKNVKTGRETLLYKSCNHKPKGTKPSLIEKPIINKKLTKFHNKE